MAARPRGYLRFFWVIHFALACGVFAQAPVHKIRQEIGAPADRSNVEIRTWVSGRQIPPQNRFLSLGQWQRLSRAFNEAADLRADDDRHMNEWLKRKIANAKDAETTGGANA
jgi:hypothetical protein